MSDTGTEEGSRRAPGDLEVLRAFLNTYEIEEERDLGPREMTEWMRGHDLLEGGEALSESDLGKAVTFREALRDVLEIEHDHEREAAALELLNETARVTPLTVRFASSETAELVPAAEGVDAAIARLLALAYGSIQQGTWTRLKTCKRHDCRWVFYDHSRNRSSNWCSMEVCGNRTKVERFREKSRAETHEHA